MKTKIKQVLAVFFLLIFPLFLHAQFVEERPIDEPSQTATAGASTFDGIANFITVLLAILFIASILGFISAGVKLLIAGGSEGMLDKGRTLAIYSAVGFFISLIGYILLNIFRYFLV